MKKKKNKTKKKQQTNKRKTTSARLSAEVEPIPGRTPSSCSARKATRDSSTPNNRYNSLLHRKCSARPGTVQPYPNPIQKDTVQHAGKIRSSMRAKGPNPLTYFSIFMSYIYTYSEPYIYPIHYIYELYKLFLKKGECSFLRQFLPAPLTYFSIYIYRVYKGDRG